MQLHFYTEYENIKKIENGIRAYVWNECVAEDEDVHISIDTNMYVTYVSDEENYFEVQKMMWKEVPQNKNMASNYY